MSCDVISYQHGLDKISLIRRVMSPALHCWMVMGTSHQSIFGLCSVMVMWCDILMDISILWCDKHYLPLMGCYNLPNVDQRWILDIFSSVDPVTLFWSKYHKTCDVISWYLLICSDCLNSQNIIDGFQNTSNTHQTPSSHSLNYPWSFEFRLNFNLSTIITWRQQIRQLKYLQFSIDKLQHPTY